MTDRALAHLVDHVVNGRSRAFRTAVRSLRDREHVVLLVVDRLVVEHRWSVAQAVHQLEQWLR